MKNKKLRKFLLSAMLCFAMATLAIVPSIGALTVANAQNTTVFAPKAAAAQVRTAPLDLRSSDADEDNAAQKWSWKKDTKTLTLNGINFEIPFTISSISAISLPSDSKIVLTKDSVNAINYGKGKNYSDDITSINATGKLTISGAGALTVDSASASTVSSSSQIFSSCVKIGNGENLSILDKATVVFAPMIALSDTTGGIAIFAAGINFESGGNLLVDGGANLTAHGQTLGVNESTTNPSQFNLENYAVYGATKIQLGKGKITALTYDGVPPSSGNYGGVIKQALNVAPTNLANQPISPTSGTTYNAQSVVYESLKNALTYFANDATSGTAPNGGMYEDGTEVTIAAAGDLLKTGCKFVGWNTAADGSGLAYAVGAKLQINQSVTLFAQWEGDKYPITINLNGGSLAGGTDLKHEYGKVTTLPIPTKIGYDFDGWYNNANFTGLPITTIGATETVMPTLFAKYRAKKITVSFQLNGGTSVNSANILVDYDSAFPALPTATRNEYEFKGWFTQLSGGVKISANDINKFVADTALYAQWKGVERNIVLNTNGGSLAGGTDLKHEYGTDTTLPIPTKPGYEFKGWFTDSEFTGDPIAKIGAETTDIPELYAKWAVVTGTSGNDTKVNVGLIIGFILIGLFLLIILFYILWKYSIIKGKVANVLIRWLDPVAVKVCGLFCKKEKLFTVKGTRIEQKERELQQENTTNGK